MTILARAFGPYERIRAAIDGNCVPSIDAERHAELIVAVARPDLDEDLKSRAAALASSDGTRRPRTEGA